MTFRLVTSVTGANPNLNDLYLDDSGQLELIGTDISNKQSYAMAIAQYISGRIQHIKGEWYLNQNTGTPWKEQVFKKGVTVEKIKRMLSKVIETTPGVRELKSISVSIDKATRQATIDFTVITESRTVVSTEDLDVPFVIEVPKNG